MPTTLALQIEIGSSSDAQAVALDVAPLNFPRRRPLMFRGRIRRRRQWRLTGADVLVSTGDQVEAADAVARYAATGRATAVDIASMLGLSPDRAAATLVRHAGEMVAEGDVIAERRTLGGLQRRSLRSPATGRLTHVSQARGTVFVEPVPVNVGVAAHLAGRVVAADERSVTVEGAALAIAGAAGAGPATYGALMVVESAEALPADAAATILACAFTIDDSVVRRAADAGVHAIVAAGIEETALDRLGWGDVLWPSPDRTDAPPTPPLTVVLLGAGDAEPVAAVWEALRAVQGRSASAVGSEPGAAPELLVMLDEPASESSGAVAEIAAPLAAGSRVRATAGRSQFLRGEIADLSEVPHRLPSEIRADVAEVAFPFDVQLSVPLLHLEALP